MSCGKGHEQSMCFITTEYLWDDRTAMRAALAEHLGDRRSRHALAADQRILRLSGEEDCGGSSDTFRQACRR